MLCYYCPKPPIFSLRWASSATSQPISNFSCADHLAKSLDAALVWTLRVEITRVWVDPIYSSEPLEKCFVCQSPKIKPYGSEKHPHPNTRCDNCSRCWNQ